MTAINLPFPQRKGMRWGLKTLRRAKGLCPHPLLGVIAGWVVEAHQFRRMLSCTFTDEMKL